MAFSCAAIRRCCTVVVVLFLTRQPLLATDRAWSGSSNTTWKTGTNWVGGTAPGTSTDNAVFNSTFSNQPSVTAAATLGGLWMTTGVGQNVTIAAGGGSIALSGNTINGTPGLGILVDNTSTYTLTINAPLSVGGAQTWTNNSANLLTIGGTLNLNGNALTLNGGGPTTISGIISGTTTAGTLTKTGSGTLTLSGANTFIGQLSVQNGTLSIATINNASTSGVLGSSALAVSLGASGTTGTLEFSGTTSASSTKTFSLTTGGTGAIQVDTAGTTLTLSGVMSGSGAFSKTGAGTLALTGINTFSGGTTINAGTLSINSASSLGASTGALTINAGTLEVSAGFSTTRSITLGNSATTIQVDTSQTFTISSAIAGSGGLTKTGAGTLVLSGANTYSGGNTLSAGTLQLSGSGTLGGTNSALTVNGGTLDLNGTSQTVGALSGNGGTILNNSTATATTLSVGTGNGTTSFAGVIADHTSGTGTVALTKAGTGTETLTGTNTFTGATIINGGTLTLANSSASALGSTSSITVNSGGTLLLGANNQIKDTAGVTLAGGTFAKGNFNEGSASTAGVGTLTLTATGSHLDFGTGTVGVLTFGNFAPGTNTLVIDNWAGTANTQGSAATDRLIFQSDQSANLSHFQFTGFSGAIEFALIGGYYEITPLSAVPEPATWVTSSLAIFTLVWRRARSRDRRTA